MNRHGLGHDGTKQMGSVRFVTCVEAGHSGNNELAEFICPPDGVALTILFDSVRVGGKTHFKGFVTCTDKRTDSSFRS